VSRQEFPNTIIGFHASHELYTPRDLLAHTQRAESAGFQAAMCSDHFHPWTPQQGNSGYSFAWLGAALQATSFPMGTICCPFDRYHPAVVAQAAATLAQMFPERFWLAIGTGQALNEHITGRNWPSKPERQALLGESAEIIRSLWAGETITHRERITVVDAKLYSRPDQPPYLFGAATTPETAKWVGTWADGLLTVNTSADQLRKVVDAFREGGGAGKPMYLQAMVGYDPDESTAWHLAWKNWPVAALDQKMLQDLPTPARMVEATAGFSVEDVKVKLRVSSDLNKHVEWLQGDIDLGFERIFLYTISGNPERFIDSFGEQVLPRLRLAKHHR
jgi:coenzyme F420-dependent glucose-6-phosphate dehydrogenase